jgi:hypothetical protein
MGRKSKYAFRVPPQKLEVTMPPVRLAAEGAEQIAEVAQSGAVSRLARQAVDLFLAREHAPIPTIGQVKGDPLASQFNRLPCQYDFSETVGSGAPKDAPGSTEQLAAWFQHVGFTKPNKEVPIALFDGVYGDDRLSVFERPDGTHVLHASARLPSSWSVSVARLGSEDMTDVTAFLNKGTTWRGAAHSFLAPDERSLALSPGMKVRVDMRDEDGKTSLTRDMVGRPLLDHSATSEYFTALAERLRKIL